jgi:hypothetical protein
MTRAEDVFVDSQRASRWLTTLTRDSDTACKEVASALGNAQKFGPFSVQRHEAVLMVDKWATPLQEELLEHYALGSKSEQGPQSKIARTLQTIAQSFGRYYDDLIDALRRVPRDRDHPYLTYVTLEGRLAHLRYETILCVLGHEESINWQKVHRLHRNAVQQRVKDAAKPAGAGAERTLSISSATSEYIQILLTARLADAKLEPAEVLCAVGWLGRWVDALAISTTPVAGDAFAVFPNGSEGLVAPPRGIKDGVLWLDVGPLHESIRNAVREETEAPDVDDGGALAKTGRIALLHRLLQLWQGPRGDDVRAEPRRALKRPVHVAIGLTQITVAMRWPDSGPETGHWIVNDVSDSGCRLHADAGSVAAVPPGTLVGLLVRETGVWIAGVVRRNVAFDSGEGDLGVQVLSASVRLLALTEGVEPQAEAGQAANEPPATLGPDRRATKVRPALLLGRGAGRNRSIKQSVILLAGDYALGRDYFCETSRHRYKLTLDKPFERIAECIWAAVRVEKLGPLQQ